MGNNHSRSTNQERGLNRTKLISNFINKNDNLDSLNITEFHNNENKIKVPLQLIPVSSLNKVGGGVVKQNNAFNEQMIKHEIFNLLHDTEIQQYHYNNMKTAGILNTDNHVITGGAVAEQPENSDVSDAMNRIKQVIMAELGASKGEQQGGAVNTSDSDSNTNGCGCESNDEKGYKHKCGDENENGKKGKKGVKGSKKGKSGKKGGKKGEGKGEKEDSGSSSSSSSGSDSSASESDSSSSANDNDDGLKNSGKGLSIFPFNSSDVQSSEKNYRLMRRKI